MARDNYSIIEKEYSRNMNGLSIGLANIHPAVKDITGNKEKIAKAIEVFKEKKVNIAIFPEFCLSGYFWDDPSRCQSYMDKAVIEKHSKWLEQEIKPLLDENLQYLILNNIRTNPGKGKRFLNTTFLISKNSSDFDSSNTYNKVFLPGLENRYTESGRDDRLVIETQWGRFGFVTCYDLCFPQLIQEYAVFDAVDAMIITAAWRQSAERSYPNMRIKTDTYYGYLWDILIPAMAAMNQTWMIACDAVGRHEISGDKFWGGSGVWTPAGIRLLQGSHQNEELIILHNVDIAGQKEAEKEDFDYVFDFKKIYSPIKHLRAFTRLHVK